jgi:hypothetical protein
MAVYSWIRCLIFTTLVSGCTIPNRGGKQVVSLKGKILVSSFYSPAPVVGDCQISARRYLVCNDEIERFPFAVQTNKGIAYFSVSAEVCEDNPAELSEMLERNLSGLRRVFSDPRGKITRNGTICGRPFAVMSFTGVDGDFCNTSVRLDDVLISVSVRQDNLYFDDEISGMVEEMLSSIVSGRPPPSLGPRQLSNRIRQPSRKPISWK